jgi:succinate dehydrogenase / fumarate reductase membrane anchor subunit
VSATYTRAGRARPTGGRFEVGIWYLMRLTGIGLFVLVLSHYLILHVLYDPAQQDAQWIAQFRWSSSFWRVFDWTMLTLVQFHAFMGMRTVVSDYTRGVLRRGLLLVLYVLGILLFVLGTIVVMTLPNVVPAG